MTFLSAYEDFVTQTLAALPTPLARLRYLAGLRDREGAYQHWGMVRTYGAEAAQAAMGRAHTGVVLELLRLPVREVFRQLKDDAGRMALPAGEYFARLSELSAALQPQKLGGGSARHFNATLIALSKLAKKAAGANLPAA
jgi:hypothetical protein